MEVDSHLTEKGIRDYKLVKLAIENGNQKAYAELMHHYRDSLYFMLLKMTNNPHDADDLMIEAFGKAFKKLDQYTPDYAFSTWLFRIASNNCIDFIRKKRKSALSNSDSTGDNGPSNDYIESLPSTGLDPEEKIIQKQKIKMTRAVVEKLKPHYKTLIELRYFKEYSYEEIAKELDIPLGTVKAQLFRAREFLSNVIKNLPEKY